MIDAVVLFRQGINAKHHLKSMSDEELIVTVAAYDVSVANLPTYGPQCMSLSRGSDAGPSDRKQLGRGRGAGGHLHLGGRDLELVQSGWGRGLRRREGASVASRPCW